MLDSLYSCPRNETQQGFRMATTFIAFFQSSSPIFVTNPEPGRHKLMDRLYAEVERIGADRSKCVTCITPSDVR